MCTGNYKPSTRKDFIKTVVTAGTGMALLPRMALGAEMAGSSAVFSGKAQHITLLHTSDIHGSVKTHQEFFWEDGKAVFKKRGGFAHLKTMVNELRKVNPNTLLMDGGDCFQGSALTSLTAGEAIIPLMNNIGYNLMLPGNWEVVFGKAQLIRNMNAYTAPKVCANMFHQNNHELMFSPYHVFDLGGIKIGVIGYNDPLTPIRQSPAYSYGIDFEQPEKSVAHYIQILREQEKCTLIIALTHMGLAQQLNLANQDYAKGIDYIFGGDTHERIRQPLQGKYSKVTEPGAFASFVAKLDIVVEDGVIKDHAYELLDVDPEKYKADEEMVQLVEKAYAPFNERFNTVIGKTTTTLMRYFVIETPMDNLITDALMWMVRPDIALSNGFRFCPPLVPDEKTGSADITEEYLWSMLPVDSEVKMAEVTGKQLCEWLEKELENVFAKDATKRFGGWLVRFKGMKINFTISAEPGKRLNSVLINDVPVNMARSYSIVACERDGDPDSVLCRIKNVSNAKNLGYTLHEVMKGYLKVYSPVSPKIEGRAVATDAPSTLLTQLEGGVNYQFR